MLTNPLDDIVMRLRSMSSLPNASTRNYSSLDNWINNNGPLSTADQELFKQDRDFAALVDPKEAVSLDGFVEDCLSMVPSRLTRVSLCVTMKTMQHDLTRAVTLLNPRAARQYKRQVRASLQQEAYRLLRPSHHHLPRRGTPYRTYRRPVPGPREWCHQNCRDIALHPLLQRCAGDLHQGKYSLDYRTYDTNANHTFRD